MQTNLSRRAPRGAEARRAQSKSSEVADHIHRHTGPLLTAALSTPQRRQACVTTLPRCNPVAEPCLLVHPADPPCRSSYRPRALTWNRPSLQNLYAFNLACELHWSG
jgi:hypothetical protein